MMPVMRIQPVTARAVGQALPGAAVAPPSARIVEIAGPGLASLVALARQVMRQRRRRVLVVPLVIPGAAGKAMRAPPWPHEGPGAATVAAPRRPARPR